MDSQMMTLLVVGVAFLIALTLFKKMLKLVFLFAIGFAAYYYFGSGKF